jgi:hypothetical protein
MISALLLSALLAAAALPPTPADGTYTYNTSANGAHVGSAQLVVSHTGNGVRIDETSSGTFNGMTVSGTATMVLGADLAPSSYLASYLAGGQSFHSSVGFNGSSANVNGPGGRNTVPLTGGARHFAVLDGSMMAGFFVLPAQIQAWISAPATVVLAPMYGQSMLLPLELATVPSRPASVPKNDQVLTVGGQLPFDEWYDPNTFLVDEVDVPSQNIVATRVR